jgi:hypothetical protein
MTTHLVTGGAGFLGSHVVRAGLEQPGLEDQQWVVLDDLSGGFSENVPEDPRVAFIQGSVGDAELIESLYECSAARDGDRQLEPLDLEVRPDGLRMAHVDPAGGARDTRGLRAGPLVSSPGQY